ncbi:MAG: hypothetical protein K0R54_823 [Clostridiaceae bacterium]|jgi:hypothetical protein|nr:hypothetical protein [Clostridiaceae bacterium]
MNYESKYTEELVYNEIKKSEGNIVKALAVMSVLIVLCISAFISVI